jgi:hypothetical protein
MIVRKNDGCAREYWAHTEWYENGNAIDRTTQQNVNFFLTTLYNSNIIYNTHTTSFLLSMSGSSFLKWYGPNSAPILLDPAPDCKDVSETSPR